MWLRRTYSMIILWCHATWIINFICFLGPIKGKRWFGTYARWGNKKTCPSHYIKHGICINGLNSLKIITQRREFSANKFLLNFEPLALDCMEEWYFNRTFAKPKFKLDYYKKQPFVNNNWMKKKLHWSYLGI